MWNITRGAMYRIMVTARILSAPSWRYYGSGSGREGVNIPLPVSVSVSLARLFATRFLAVAISHVCSVLWLNWGPAIFPVTTIAEPLTWFPAWDRSAPVPCCRAVVTTRRPAHIVNAGDRWRYGDVRGERTGGEATPVARFPAP